MAGRRNASVSLKEGEQTLLSAAAEMLLLHGSDLVRLALRAMLPTLPATFSDLAAMQAHRLFIDKAWQRWGKPFEEMDFRHNGIRRWLREMNTENLAIAAEVTPNNLFAFELYGGPDSAFDKYRKDENPRIIAARALNREAFRNAPSVPPDYEWAKLFFEALSTPLSNPRREAAKQEIRSAMIHRIESEFLAVVTKFRAIPKLFSEAQRLGATPSFLELYRNDPETLARFVSYKRMNLGRRGHPDDFWLTNPPQGIAEYRRFLSEPSN